MSNPHLCPICARTGGVGETIDRCIRYMLTLDATGLGCVKEKRPHFSGIRTCIFTCINYSAFLLFACNTEMHVFLSKPGTELVGVIFFLSAVDVIF